MKRSYAALVSCALLGLCACSETPDPPASSATYSRVVTLAPNLAELVFAAGAGGKLVGASAYSDYPASARQLPVIGDAFAVDQEQLAILQPDLLLVWEAHQLAFSLLRPGVTTGEIDAVVEGFFARHNAVPLFKGVPGRVPFPAVTCISINEEVVHGIPGDRRLEDGDIVSLDCGCIWRGYHADSALTVAVGDVSPAAQHVIDVSRGALEAGIAALGPGAWLWDVMAAVQGYVEGHGMGVVREYQGHGIGRSMHEPPSVPNEVRVPHSSCQALPTPVASSSKPATLVESLIPQPRLDSVAVIAPRSATEYSIAVSQSSQKPMT